MTLSRIRGSVVNQVNQALVPHRSRGSVVNQVNQALVPTEAGALL